MHRDGFVEVCVPEDAGNVLSHELRLVVDGHGADLPEVGVFKDFQFVHCVFLL